MAKLYIFAIGGTGSRVLRAMSMLFAAGVQLPDGFDKVVPIIIDPDTANGDTNRTQDMLLKYQNIQKFSDGEGFFSAEIQTLKQLLGGTGNTINNNFKFLIDGTTSTSFKKFIGYNSMKDEDCALVDLLYTPEDLELNLQVGFKGNPNIGSVVLNQFAKSAEYQEFAKSFSPGDAIFIVSSIFGGTGAAGFPLLLKNLRTHYDHIDQAQAIKNSVIGAISYLPYFKLASPNGDEATIDSSTFFFKAKSALNYYEHSIFKNNSINAFYYIGDHSDNHYDNHDGKASQKNNAHFVELAGALSIIDFMENVGSMSSTNAKADELVSKEFGIINDTRQIELKDLGAKDRQCMSLPLAKLKLLQIFIHNGLNKSLESKDAWHQQGLEGFFRSSFYENEFCHFMKYFSEWLEELENNDVSFAPYSDPQQYEYLMDFIKGYPVKNTTFSKKAHGKKIIQALSVKAKEMDGELAGERRFIKLFNDSLTNVVQSIIHD